MSNPSLELISFSVCPFVMRARIILGLKNVDYKMTLIDLSNKPEWFLKISPLGKVPVLRVDDEVAVFESQVICEYINEITMGSVHSEDALQRAHDRAWIEFASQLTFAGFGHLTADAEQQDATKENLDNLLQHVENHLSDTRYFSSDNMQMIDAAFAPFFVQLDTLKKKTSLDLLAPYQKVSRLSEVLLSQDAVQATISDTFYDDLAAVLKAYGSAYFAE